MQHVAVDYRDARRKIADGDVLLFRPRGMMWRPIAVAGRSEYCHAAMAGWWNGRLMCVEMTAGGGRAQLLSNLVDRWPGTIDVYRLDEIKTALKQGFKDRVSADHVQNIIAHAALNRMIAVTGRRYGWWSLFRASLYHLPFFRFMVSPDTKDAEVSRWPQFCSEAVADAYRSAGVDLVPNLSDRLTEPGDLARSALLQYQFTLGR